MSRWRTRYGCASFRGGQHPFPLLRGRLLGKRPRVLFHLFALDAAGRDLFLVGHVLAGVPPSDPEDRVRSLRSELVGYGRAGKRNGGEYRVGLSLCGFFPGLKVFGGSGFPVAYLPRVLMALSIVPANSGGSAFCMAYHQNSGHKSQTPFTANPKVPPAGGRFPIANRPKRARPGETAASERRPDPVPSQAQPRPAGARLAARTWPQRPSPSLGRLVRSAGRPELDCSTNCTRRRRRRGSVELAVRREKPALPAGLSYMPAGVDERRSLEQLAHQRRVVPQQRIDDVPCSRHGRPPASSVHAAARRPVDYMGSVGRTASCQIRRDFPRGPQAGVFGGAAHACAECGAHAGAGS